jgi:hypothetical protein
MMKNIGLSIVTVIAAAIVATGLLSTVLVEQHAYAQGTSAGNGTAVTPGASVGNGFAVTPGANVFGGCAIAANVSAGICP